MIGERIKELRKFLNLTQQEFAQKIGIKRNTIAKYETGRGEPIDAVVSLICRVFDVNEHWLRSGEGEMLKKTSSSTLDSLIEEYSLPCEFRVLLEKFLDLKPAARQIVLDYVRDVANTISKLP